MHNFGRDEGEARRLFAELLGGSMPPPPPPPSPPVAVMVQKYLAQLDCEPKTRTDYADRLAWLVARWGLLTPAELDPAAVEAELRAAVRTTGKGKGRLWTPNARRQTAIVVTAFVRWCGVKEFRLKKPKPESRGDEYLLTPDEAGKLLAVAEGDFGPFLRTLWLTGCRPGEARTMTAESVNWQAGVCVLRKHKTARKTGRPRVIPLSPAALGVLAGQRDRYGRGWLFRSDGVEPYQSWEVGRLMRRARAAAGLRAEVILYGYRHTFAATLVRQGEPTGRVATILGHTSSSLVESVYGHLSSDVQVLRAAAGRVGEG